MTRRSIREYVEAVRSRYLASDKKGKGRILDEFTKVTGRHRKAAIRLLTQRKHRSTGKRGRPPGYGAAAREALLHLWEVADHLCSKRLHPFLAELATVMKRHGELAISTEAEQQLLAMSPSTIDRVLHPHRLGLKRRPLTTTRPGSLLRSAIPIRTFSEWTENRPGFMEVDLVAHCGESAEGFYLNTLCAVDVATGWNECLAVWGKGQQRVRSAVYRVQRQLPFPLRGLDSDNGSEFINQSLYDYCRREKITFTRSRAYKKNDSCHVEQKNWSIVRRLVGYDRFTSRGAYAALQDVYEVARLYVNFFQPTLKLRHKSRQGARIHKTYDVAQTPYQRLLEDAILTEEQRRQLGRVYEALDPVVLRRQLQERLEKLWAQAQHHPYGSTPPR